eukprot:2489060-Prymnesium_polylepis.1
MVSCVRRALVCAEKEIGRLAHSPSSTSLLIVSVITADLPTPDEPVKSVGRLTAIERSST